MVSREGTDIWLCGETNTPVPTLGLPAPTTPNKANAKRVRLCTAWAGSMQYG
jgi:hypothetical protein